ncbi:MAG TPA: DUF4384 domain-containing protein [Salinivirgaceae bacterium]|nr:DUF4384 domain-containing protein [Salinivirgaceae bacterium]
MIIRHLIIIIGLFCLTLISIAQKPEWTDAAQRRIKFNDKEYVVGFASEKNNQKENPTDLLTRLENYAKGQIAEYIQVTIRSESLLDVKENHNNYQQTFSRISHSATNLNLTGLKVEKYYDTKERTAYCLVYSKRTDVMNYYSNIVNTKLTEAERIVKQATEILATQGEQAHKFAMDALNLLTEVEQAQSIIMALKPTNFEQEIQIDRYIAVKSAIDKVIVEITRGSSNSIDDACYFLAQSLKQRTGELDSPIMLSIFTYQDSRIGSELSNRVNQSLASKLVSSGGYKVVTSGSTPVKYILTGTYWKENEEIKLICNLREINGSIIATAEACVSMKWLTQNNIRYLPDNFEEAYARMKVFGKDEIVRGDLNIEIWTNKGDDNQIFFEGEELKFYIRANKECYVRLIYHLADNRSVLLYDNFYIAEHMVNKVVEIPEEFICAEPFGVETLQVNAQTAPFSKLNVKKENGYDFILGSLNDVLVATRGIQKKKSETFDKAEKRVVFTTMKK